VYDVRLAGLEREREDLFERIDRRVAAMLESGLREESSKLAAGGLGRTARQALGYRQIFDGPEASDEELHAEIVRATKRFARRQISWFRADPRVTWFDAAAPDIEDRLAAFLAE
jgi:tRNA dimethylallyltransferase